MTIQDNTLDNDTLKLIDDFIEPLPEDIKELHKIMTSKDTIQEMNNTMNSWVSVGTFIDIGNVYLQHNK